METVMTRNVAVAGATGFIGRHLVRALDVTDDVVAVSAPRFQADLRGVEAASNLVYGAQLVYLCAGVTTGSGAAGAGGRNLVADNVRIALSLFEACAKAGVKKIISMSSTTGYPDRDNLSEDEFFEGEVHPAYEHVGESKRFIERVGAMYPEVEVTFIRCAGCYGPGADFNPATSHVIEATIRKISEGQNPLVVWGDGEDERDAVYIDDLVKALILAADAPPGAYNIACGRGMTVNQMLRVLMYHNPAYDPEVTKIEHDLTKPKMIRTRKLDTTRAREILGWKPTVSMPEGLVKTYDWYHARQ